MMPENQCGSRNGPHEEFMKPKISVEGKKGPHEDYMPKIKLEIKMGLMKRL